MPLGCDTVGSRGFKNHLQQSWPSRPNDYLRADDPLLVLKRRSRNSQLDWMQKKLFRQRGLLIRLARRSLFGAYKRKPGRLRSCLLAFRIQLLLLFLASWTHHLWATKRPLQSKAMGSQLPDVHIHRRGPPDGLGFLATQIFICALHKLGKYFIDRVECFLVPGTKKSQQRDKGSRAIRDW